MDANRKTPGVYIQEVQGFPNAVTAVETAVPAFIAYTPQVNQKAGAALFEPVLIESMVEFMRLFAFPADSKTGVPPPQYAPVYYITKVNKAPDKGTAYPFNGELYAIEPDPGTIWYFYNSLQLFFQNGGKKAYIVPVGTYGSASGAPIQPGGSIVNPNVKLADLQKGLAALKKIPEVTMYVFPEATLLSVAENGTLMESALLQCEEMQTAVAIFDVIGGREPDPVMWGNDIQTFRANTGSNGLKYGVAYYPFLKTTAVPIDKVTRANIGGDKTVLDPLLNDPQSYKQILAIIQEKINVLPPSSIMAGIYTLVDETKGVWTAPANISPIGVHDVTIRINSNQQGNLNVDAVSGKSINAIRYFPGQGILVWGARTLDGNSQDWRYINVRRTVTMIEQSAKLTLRYFVFEPNDANTWTTVRATLENFLTILWQQGALIGYKPQDAFGVQVGLGSTMTQQDILEGRLRVNIHLALVRPAEFIVISLEQQLGNTA